MSAVWSRAAVGLALALLLGACTPTLNWREVRLPPGRLLALLPCKPDEAVRSVPLVGESRSLTMVGCEAGGVTYAVAHIGVARSADAAAVLQGWRNVTLAHWGPLALQDLPAPMLRGAVPLSAQRQSLRGGRTAGGPLAIEVAWLAVADGAGVALYQATALGAAVDAAAIDTFMGGLRWQ